MKWIGITGGMGSGKSALAQFLREMNQPVIEADVFAHEALSEKSPVYKKIVKVFGQDILDKNQKINHKKLGKKVFSQSHLLSKLESIIHPFVQKKVEKERKKIKNSGFSLCFYELPLLFEKNLQDDFDEIILLASKRDTQKKRLLQKSHISEEEIEMRLKNQMSTEEKRKKADFIIENEGSLEELKNKTKTLLKEINGKQTPT